MIRSVIALPSLPGMAIVRARLDISGGGNGASPRRRPARACWEPVIHQSGWPSINSIILAFSAAVSGSIAALRNRAGSNGRASVTAISFVEAGGEPSAEDHRTKAWALACHLPDRKSRRLDRLPYAGAPMQRLSGFYAVGRQLGPRYLVHSLLTGTCAAACRNREWSQRAPPLYCSPCKTEDCGCAVAARR